MFRLFECCALSFFERFVLSFSLKIERFVSDSAEIWICGLYNRYAFSFLKEICPGKIFIPLELKKHNTDPRAGILHLDCTFMPVGKGHAIIYKDGFMYPQDYHTLLDLFGRENVFEITREEMYYMNTNVFSISPEVVVSEKNFIRLNTFMEEVWGMTVERVPYYEISKMGGLLRCSTLPLIREND